MVDEKLRGVNLGGWLVLERWLKPSLFSGSDAQDEYTFVSELGKKATQIMHGHFETYITENDFKWIAGNRLTAVRIPVGYWIFGDEPPYQKNIEYLDFAMEQAEENGLKVLIDFHAAPGSQNGWQHSGKKGAINWPIPENISKSLQIIEKLSKRYRSSANLFGIELINEPHWTIKREVLIDYYNNGYEIVRQQCGVKVAVIFSDAFRPDGWTGFGQGLTNTYMDLHFYEVHSKFKANSFLNWRSYIKRLESRWDKQITKMQEQLPVIIGEWSAAYSYKNNEIDDDVTKTFIKAELNAFNRSTGWFYWNYKTENKMKWDLRKCIENGWLKF